MSDLTIIINVGAATTIILTLGWYWLMVRLGYISAWWGMRFYTETRSTSTSYCSTAAEEQSRG